MALEPGTQLGPYEVLGPLGAGGMGEVYRARDTRLDRLVAIKVLPSSSPDALERFTRETRAIAALNHPGICAVYDVGTSPRPFLVMELLEGDTLHQRLGRGPLDVPGIIEIGIVLADALASAHAKGIVHRDLKPANIVLTARGPKILDFGLARIVETPAQEVDVSSQPTVVAHAPLTDAGIAIGTVAYMSPEQLRGAPLDARTDLFSLGLVLYEMATGRRAFAGATSAVASAAILHDQPAAPRHLRPDVPVRLEQAILTLLEKDRETRTQTATELRAELLRLKRELGSSPRPSEGEVPGTTATESAVATARIGTTAPPPSSSDAQLVVGLLQRHRGAVAAVAALAVASIAAAAYFTGAGSGGGPTADPPALSIADLSVEALTTSGTAGLPTISPDGNYVVYVENAGGNDSLRLRQVATSSNVELVKAEPGVALLGATVTPDGTFVNYVKQAPPQPPELWQIPFLGGVPRRLVPGIGGRVAFSPDGRQMAFVRAVRAGETEIVVSAADGSGERVVATRRQPNVFFTAAVRQAFAPAWSPDGRTLAVIGGRGGSESIGQVVFVDVQSGAERPVVVAPNSTLAGTGLAWLDDGAVLVSMFDRVSAPLQLWLLSYPEGTPRRLTNDTTQYVQPNFTADRRGLVVARNDASFSVWTSDAAAKTWTAAVPTTAVKGPIGFRLRWQGQDLLFMTTASAGFALTRWHTATRTSEVVAQSSGNQSVSRDGSVLVFYDFDTSDLWKSDATGRTRTRLGRGQGAAPQGGRLSPDGRQLVFVDPGRPQGPAVLVQSTDEPTQIREVTADRVRGGAAEISPDGTRLAFTAFDDRRQPSVVVCDFPACGSRKTLPALGPIVRWMPDGQALVYVDPVAQSDLWVQPIDGTAARQLTSFPADGQRIWDFDWSSNGQVAVARGRISSDIVLFKGFRPAAR